MYEGLGRKKRRFHVHLAVKVSLRSALQPFGRLTTRTDRTEHSFTKDISGNGCYILLSREMPVGSVVELEMTLPSPDQSAVGGKIHCHAVVVRTQPDVLSGKVGIGCKIQHFRFYNPSSPAGTRDSTTNLARAVQTVLTTRAEFLPAVPMGIAEHVR